MKTARLLAVICAALVQAQCDTSATEPEMQDERLEGIHALVRYQGAALPYAVTPLPERGGEPPRCDLLLNEGFLALAERSGHFNIGYTHINSCNGDVLSRFVAGGTFQRTGNELRFVRDGNPPTEFRGEVRTDELVLVLHGAEYVFAR